MSLALSEMEPRGLWSGPLTVEQLNQAVAWGIDRASVAEEDDPFSSWLDDMKVLVTVGTPFERVSTYARTMTRDGKPIDASDVQRINATPMFEAHYGLKFTSSVKTLSVMRIADTNGKRHYDRMLGAEYWGTGRTRHQIAFFTYPSSKVATQRFEIVATKLLLFATAMRTFEIRLDALH